MRKSFLLLITFLSLFGYANAQWNWLNPNPTGNQLRGVCFTDANTGTAVGKLGTILRTLDGGSTWTLQSSGTANFLTSVHFIDANNGSAVGYSNNGGGEAAILHTTDGGTTWNWQSSGTATTNYLTGVFFTDANTGTAVGSNGIILRTTDGGTTWNLQTSGTTGSLNGVYFTSINTGIIVGSNGILRTADGGTTWNSVSSSSLNAVSFADANVGTAVGVNTILRTTDGGLTWVPQSGAGTFYGVSMTDANTGTAVGSAGKIVHTIDAGVHWIVQTSGTTNVLFGISGTDNNSGTVVGDVGKILKTINGGTNWVSQSKGEVYDMYSVSFTDANTGWAVGGGSAAPVTGRILKTTDGGANWTLKTSPVANRILYGVSFPDTNNGTAVGMGGVIIHTPDGGATWVSQPSGVTGNLYGVSFTDANTGTAVGAGSLGSGTILRTTDGGATWVPQTAVITSNGFFGVHFTDANNGTAVGQGGVIVHTTDGGATWITQSSGVSWNLQGVYFTDNNTGWAAGSAGILHTTDGGANWIQQLIPGGASLFSISMSDANNGTSVGVAGKIFHTTDGGANWIPQFSGTSVDLRGVTCLSSGNSFAAGKTGTILGSIATTPPPAGYAVTGGGSYCQGGSGLPVGVANSESGVNYTLYKDNVAQVPTVGGTGSSISFGNQLFGTYTVNGTNGGGTTPMTGSAVIIETPALAVSVTITADINLVPEGTAVTLTAVPVNGGATPSYQWAVNEIITGNDSAVFTYTPANNDAVTCILTSSETCTYGNPATSNQVVIKVIPQAANLQNIIVANGETNCYNAIQTINVAGGGSTFTVQSGGSATMIAGQNIVYLPGTKVDSGGYMNGYITLTGNYCTNPANPVVSQPVQDGGLLTTVPEIMKNHSVRVYPNPTEDAFTLELTGSSVAGITSVEIFNMNGLKVVAQELDGERKQTISVSGLRPGLYFVHVTTGNSSETIKLIKL